MKNIILVANVTKAEFLIALGFTPCGKREVDGQTIYQFVESDELLKIINDESQFCKRDFVYDKRLTF